MPARQLHQRSMTSFNTGTLSSIGIPRRSIAGALSVLFFTSLYLTTPGVGQAEPVAESRSIEASQHYSIPAGPLAPALRQLASNSNVLLTFTDAQTAGKTTGGIDGNYTLSAALSALLAGAGLQAVQVSGGGYVLRIAPEIGESTLPELNVSTRRENPDQMEGTAASPVNGYVVKHSATGTKTDTPIIETPQSITVIGKEEMRTLGAQSLQDAFGYVAGVSRFESLSRVQDTMYIRGFQAQAGTGSMYRDGTKYTVNAFNGKQEVYGLERVELLKGASSVLYGSAGPGGIINMVSKRPTTTSIRELNLEFGSFDRKQVSGDFGGTLDQDGEWSYRFTFLQRDSNTFVDHVSDDRTFIAPALKWQPTADTSITFLADYQKDRTNYVYWLPAQGTIFPTIYGKIPRDRFTGEPGYSKFDLERYSFGYLFEHAFNENLKIRNSLRYFNFESDFPQVWVSGLAADQRTTAYRGGTLRWESSSSIVSDTSLQYQASHGNIQHTALIGVDYARPKNRSERYDRTASSLDYYSPVYGGPLGQPTPDNWWSYKSDTKQVGVYVQDHLKIANKWVALLGGRYDSVTYDQSNLFTGEKTVDNEKSTAFTGRAGFVYLADNGLAPFFSYSQSFEPTVGRDRLGKRFDPTTGTQYEIGTRYQPKGSNTLISAVIYQLTRENVEVTDPVNPTYSAQIGEVRSRGFELEARANIDDHANIIAAYTYTDARTTKASPLEPSVVGQRSPGIPYNQLSIWGDYRFSRFGLPNLQLGLGMRYQSETRPNTGNYEVPSFTIFDAVASYVHGPWRIAMNVTNLFDKTYIGSCTTGCFYGEPRKAILSTTYHW